MRNIAMRLSYDGTAYHGWQVQKKERTVCEELENAIEKICKHPAKLIGCGRTDAGVHALSYCASFKTDCTIPTGRIPIALNSVLPSDIAVLDAVEAQSDFNAILSCVKKEYVYRIINSQIRDPLSSRFTSFFPGALDFSKMQVAAEHFVGTHDFMSVRSVGTETKTTVRTVHWCDLKKERDLISMHICADGFLYNMVRSIMGTLVYVGLKKLLPSDIPRLLEQRDRRCAGPTMPPEGLLMSRVWYEGAVGEMMDKDYSQKVYSFLK